MTVHFDVPIVALLLLFSEVKLVCICYLLWSLVLFENFHVCIVQKLDLNLHMSNSSSSWSLVFSILTSYQIFSSLTCGYPYLAGLLGWTIWAWFSSETEYESRLSCVPQRWKPITFIQKLLCLKFWQWRKMFRNGWLLEPEALCPSIHGQPGYLQIQSNSAAWYVDPCWYSRYSPTSSEPCS